MSEASANPNEGDEGNGDMLPGQPWTPEVPSPDGGMPEGDGDHRK